MRHLFIPVVIGLFVMMAFATAEPQGYTWEPPLASEMSTKSGEGEIRGTTRFLTECRKSILEAADNGLYETSVDTKRYSKVSLANAKYRLEKLGYTVKDQNIVFFITWK